MSKDDQKKRVYCETVSFVKGSSSGREIRITQEHLTEALKSYFLTKPLISETEEIVDIWRTDPKGAVTFVLRIEETE